MRKTFETSVVHKDPKGIVVKCDLNHGETVMFHAFTAIGHYVFDTYDRALRQIKFASELMGK